MIYFLTQKCTEAYSPEHTYTFSGKSHISENIISVTVKAKDLFNFNQGAHIQDAFPYLTVDEREWMLTGMCGI